MSFKRSVKSFAVANTVAAFAFAVPVTAQVAPNAGFGFGNLPAAAVNEAVIEDVAVNGAIRQIPAKNWLYVPNGSQPVRVQLTKLDGTKASELAGTVLSVVSPDATQSRFQVNDDGVVVFKPERTGVYSFISMGPQGHVAFPVVIRLGNEGGTDDGSAVDSGMTPTIKLSIFTLGASEASRAVSSYLPPSQWTLSDIDSPLVATGEITSTIDYRVNLSQTGRMEGQVVTLMQDRIVRQNIEGNNLLLYKNGELIARAISDELGRFAFEQLQPGNYGIICAGPGGYGAFGFEAVMPSLTTSKKSNETFVTKMVQQSPVAGPYTTADVLPIIPIPRPLITGLPALLRTDELIEEEIVMIQPEAAFAPVPGGGGAGFGGGPGGGFGGGGGGGGIGGAGGLLGLAGLGVAAALAASDSNDRVITNPTPDPATPANVLP